MSRFNPYLDQSMFARARPPALFRLRGPRLAFGFLGFVLMAALAAGLLAAAPVIEPALALPLDGVLTGLIGAMLAALMLSPMIQDGVSPAGVLLRGALSFALVGLLAPIAMIGANWHAEGLHTATRLATMLSDGAISIGVSALVHGIVGAIVALIATLFVSQLER